MDYLTEIDVGIWEQELDDETWAMWIKAKRDIAQVAVDHGGSISACHGACREGEVDVVPIELGGAYDVMKQIKRTLDPNNVMNPASTGSTERSRRTSSDARSATASSAGRRPPRG